MRFAGRVAAANYIAAGRASADQAADMAMIARTNAPDYQELSETAINEQAKNYKQAQDVRADIAEAGLMAQARVEMQKAENDIAQAKRDGKIGAAKGAMISQAGGLIGNSLSKPPESLTKPFEPTDTSVYQKALDKYRSQQETEAGIQEDLRSQMSTGTVSDDGSPSDTSTGSSTSGAGGGVSSSGIRSDVYSYLTNDKGLSANHALGLMANIDRESGFNPSIRSGDDGGPGGLFQWKGSRQTSTVASLVDSGDWKGQIDYALNEPENLSAVKPGSYQAMSFNSPQDAADWWMTRWERPADPHSGSKKHTQFLSGYSF